MDKTSILEALNKAKESSKSRNFKQSFDLIISLKNLDMKKTEHQIDAFINLPHAKGKKVKICALIGPELEENAKNICDYILSDNFQKYKKNEIKKLAGDFDFFIAQANIMPKIATSFGKVFGPRGKMPNPKAGCVVPPNANLAQTHEKLQKTIRISSKSSPVLQCAVGLEDMNIDNIAENVSSVYSSVIRLLPNEKNNVKDIYLKLTMGKSIKVIEKKEESKKKQKTASKA